MNPKTQPGVSRIYLVYRCFSSRAEASHVSWRRQTGQGPHSGSNAREVPDDSPSKSRSRPARGLPVEGRRSRCHILHAE